MLPNSLQQASTSPGQQADGSEAGELPNDDALVLPGAGHLTYAREAMSEWIRQEWKPAQTPPNRILEPVSSNRSSHNIHTREATGSSSSQEDDESELSCKSSTRGIATPASPPRHPFDGPKLLVASGAPKLWSRVHQSEDVQQAEDSEISDAHVNGERPLSP